MLSFTNRFLRTMRSIVKYSQTSLYKLFIHLEVLNQLYLTECQGALDIPGYDFVMLCDIDYLKMTANPFLLSPTVWERSFNRVRSYGTKPSSIYCIIFKWSHAGKPCSLNKHNVGLKNHPLSWFGFLSTWHNYSHPGRGKLRKCLHR